MYYLYVIQHTTTKQIYIGYCKDLKVRITEHNKGYTKSTHRVEGEWKIVYAEIYAHKKDAQQREHRLKHHGRAKQELIKRITNSLF